MARNIEKIVRRKPEETDMAYIYDVSQALCDIIERLEKTYPEKAELDIQTSGSSIIISIIL